MIPPTAVLCLGLLWTQQNNAGGSDPLRTIRAMVQRGDYSDAMEAIIGLPEPHKSREETFLCFQTFALGRAHEAGLRAIAADPKDAAILRSLGDVAFVEGDLREAHERYTAAAAVVDHDARLADAERAAEKRTLEQRGEMLEREEAYRGRVRTAEQRAWLGAAGFLALLLGLTGAGLALSIRGKRPVGGGRLKRNSP